MGKGPSLVQLQGCLCMANESNAGPYEVGLDGPLSPGESETIRLPEVPAGPAGKEGYLRKIFGDKGGVDYIFMVNASGELLSYTAKGGGGIIPSATSIRLDSSPYRSVTVTNDGVNDVNTGSNDQVSIEVGNGERAENEESEGFSAKKAAEDLIPGLSL